MLFRVAPLLNAEALVNSDTAVVGLQAMHVARGELSPLLWGTLYQGTIESVLAAPLVAAFGDRPALGLAVSTLLGHLVLLLALMTVLARVVGPFAAWLLCATLAFGPSVMAGYSLTPPRIWAFALVMVGLALAERALIAQTSRGLQVFAALAGLSVGLGYYSDLFVMELMPGVVLYAFWTLRGLPPATGRGRVLGAVVLGFAVASVPRIAAGMAAGSLKDFSLRNASRNAGLFSDCLQVVLGWARFAKGSSEGWKVALAVAGLAAFAALLTAGAARGLARRATGPERRLAWLGASWIGAGVLLFLLTRRPVDIESARYLSPVILGFPLVAAAAVSWLSAGRWKRPALAATALVATFFSAEAWATWGDFRRDGLPYESRDARAPEERLLLAELQQQGVEGVLADYWTAYRLSFLWKEKLIAVDLDGSRRPQYLEVLSHARRTAVLFDRQPPPIAPIEVWEAVLDRQQRSHHRGGIGGFPFLVIDGPLSAHSHGARLEVASVPSHLARGAQGTVRLKATNIGDFPWQPSVVFAAWHLLDARGRMLELDGRRTALPREIWPGESVDLDVAVDAPAEAGVYQVELDFVQELVCWFKERGSETYRFPLTVDP